MLGLCLVAGLAIAAIAATTASALPEWGRCVEKAGGKYTDSNCTKKASLKTPGTFEFKKGTEIAPVKFEGGNIGSGGVLYGGFEECAAHPEFPGGGHDNESYPGRFTRQACSAKTFEPEGSISGTGHGVRTSSGYAKVECESEHNKGEAFGSKSIRNVVVVFHGCKLFGSIPCSNSTNEGEVVVNQLKGELGYINKKEHKVGVMLTPTTKNGEFAKFICNGTLGIIVGVGNKTEGAYYVSSGCLGPCVGTKPEEEAHGGYDGIISPITPVNQTTSTYEQVFTVNHEDIHHVFNEPTHFEGKHIDQLETFVYEVEKGAEESTMWAGAGEEITNVNTAAEAGEIKA